MKDCECAKCRRDRGEILAIRMYLCPICGNKRCPHIEWHKYKCTHSNQPDQIGEIDSKSFKQEALEDLESGAVEFLNKEYL